MNSLIWKQSYKRNSAMSAVFSCCNSTWASRQKQEKDNRNCNMRYRQLIPGARWYGKSSYGHSERSQGCCRHSPLSYVAHLIIHRFRSQSGMGSIKGALHCMPALSLHGVCLIPIMKNVLSMGSFSPSSFDEDIFHWPGRMVNPVLCPWGTCLCKETTFS